MSQPYEQAPPAPSGPAPGGPSGPRSGFWRRFAAWLIDVVLVVIMELILVAIFGRGGLASGLSLVLSYAYYTYMEGRDAGQTIGMMALGIRVYDFRRGGPIGYGRAFIRQISQILSSIPLFLGYFWML